MKLGKYFLIIIGEKKRMPGVTGGQKLPHYLKLPDLSKTGGGKGESKDEGCNKLGFPVVHRNSLMIKI